MCDGHCSKVIAQYGGLRKPPWMQTVKKALAEVVAAEAAGKKVDEAVIEYVGEGALFQLHIKTTLLAIKVIDEPEQWNPRVSLITGTISMSPAATCLRHSQCWFRARAPEPICP